TLINADTKLQSPHGYNPLERSNHPQLTKVIKKTKSDLGLMWDGDGDRCVFFDERGKFVEPYYINCLVAAIMLQNYPKATIAIDSRMPVGPSTIITNHKGTPQVISPGWSLIIRAMTKSKAVFGCEHSAHFFIDIAKLLKQRRQQVVADTIIVPLLVISYLKEHKLTLSEAVASYQQQFAISGELNFENVDAVKVVKAIRRKYARKKIITTDGISVFGGQWFFNLRPSNTEPLVRLNIEATDKAHVDSLRLELEKAIKKFQS
ncbi:MAG: hypothetical protein KBB55_04105, partial [Candidatus Buchananbacteria bacterium]|nr:hypothetical protein [Candidatus Buchananbacteria bacterium]